MGNKKRETQKDAVGIVFLFFTPNYLYAVNAPIIRVVTLYITRVFCSSLPTHMRRVMRVKK